MRVGEAVRLALSGPGPVHVQLVLLVTRHIGAGAHDRRARQGEAVAGVGVDVGPRASRKGPTDPLRLPVVVGQPGLEGGLGRQWARPVGGRPRLNRPAVHGVGRQPRAPVGDEGLRCGAHPTAVPHHRGRRSRVVPTGELGARHHDAVPVLDRIAPLVAEVPCEVDVIEAEPDGSGQSVDGEGPGCLGRCQPTRTCGLRRGVGVATRDARTGHHQAGRTRHSAAQHLTATQNRSRALVSTRSAVHCARR